MINFILAVGGLASFALILFAMGKTALYIVAFAAACGIVVLLLSCLEKVR